MGPKLAGAEGKFSYSIYLVSGLLPWTAFSNTLSRTTTVFLDKKNVISKINIALPSMPFYINISETITFLISLAAFYVFLLLTGQKTSEYHLMIPFILMLQQMLAYALGLILAVFTVFIRDLREVVGIILQIWFWFTPIVYVKEILPGWVKRIMIYNPAFILADSFQNIILWNKLPVVNHLIVLTWITFLLLLTAYFVFTRLESDVKDFV